AQAAHDELAARLGPDHADTLQALGDVAHAAFIAGDHEEAMALFLSTAERAERALGPDHSVAITARHNYAAALRDIGHSACSAPHTLPLVGLSAAIYAADHPQPHFAKNSLAAALVRIGRTDEAERLLRETWQGLLRTLGPDHPDTSSTALNLANVLL